MSSKHIIVGTVLSGVSVPVAFIDSSPWVFLLSFENSLEQSEDPVCVEALELSAAMAVWDSEDVVDMSLAQEFF